MPAPRRHRTAPHLVGMRYALALLGFALLVSPASADAPIPRMQRASSIRPCGPISLPSAWSPAPVKAEQSGCTIGREDVCERYPETEFCAGTGMGACGFLWSKNNTLIQVKTVARIRRPNPSGRSLPCRMPDAIAHRHANMLLA